MTAGFARDSSLTDEDNSVGEVLLREPQRASRIQKAAIASVCGAALVFVGFVAGRWQVNRPVLGGQGFIGKTASYEQFGKEFSAATAGKSWPEIQQIKQNTLAGQGALGAAYEALQPAHQLDFQGSSTASIARGNGHSYTPVSTGGSSYTRGSSYTNANDYGYEQTYTPVSTGGSSDTRGSSYWPHTPGYTSHGHTHVDDFGHEQTRSAAASYPTASYPPAGW